MKLIVICFLINSIVSCANKKNVCSLSEKKANACIEIYDPVCAISKVSVGKQIKVTKSNRCYACQDNKTEFIVQGQCENYPRDSFFCDPKLSQFGWMCNQVYDPVCGYFDQSIKCFAPPCANTYSNLCTACINSNISYIIKGECYFAKSN